MIKSNIKIWMFGCIGLLGLNGCNDSFFGKVSGNFNYRRRIF